MTTGENGEFTLLRDISNIWGEGPLLTVVAWAWARDEVRYLDAAFPGVPNFIGTFHFPGPRPLDINVEESFCKSFGDSTVSEFTFDAFKAQYR